MPSPPEAELERELDRLYGLPLGAFTAARDEEAKRLRAEGQRELATQVKGLRKPAAAAWVANQLVREREVDIQRLLKAGKSLAEAQVGAASGASADAFAQARRDEQQALDRLSEAAKQIAGREGLGAGVVERTVRTLRAASLTDEGRELLRQGRLTAELEPPGFEALAGLAGTAASRGRRKRPVGAQRGGAGEREERRKSVSEARQRLRRRRADERELAKAAGAAEREAEQVERRAAELREKAARARAEADRAADARAVAEKELERLEAER